MRSYASVFYEQAFFIFGGNDGYKDLSQIGRLDAVTRKWSLAGSLYQARWGHSVVFDGSRFLVIGGFGGNYFKTENCFPNGTTINCTEQPLGLYNYAFYPEIMLVDENFAKDCYVKSVLET